MPTIKELCDDRARKFEALKEFNDGIETRSEHAGVMTAEEQGNFERLSDELDKLDERIERMQKLEQRSRWGDESLGRQTQLPQPGSANPDDLRREGGVTENRSRIRGLDESTQTITIGRHVYDMADLADSHELRSLHQASVVEARSDMRARATFGYGDVFDAFLRYGKSGLQNVPLEQRSGLQVDVDNKGGYFASTQMAAGILAAKDDLCVVRGMATVHPLTTAVSLGKLTLDSGVGDLDWVGEISTVAEDDSITIGKRSLTPHPLAKFVKVSNELLRVGTVPVEAVVRDRLAYKASITEENAYLNGDGAHKPLGMMIASNDGIPTTRDVTAGTPTGGLTGDGLIDAFYSLKDGYREKSTWLFHRLQIRDIRKLTHSETGQYLWTPGLNGAPSSILERPIRTSEYMPYALAEGSYVGLLGDFSYYWIADSLGISIRVLEELLALSNQTIFLMRQQTDGMPMLAEAFARLKVNA